VAHDFNNLLAVILGSLDLARNRLGKGISPLKDLDRIGGACLRARDLIRQILNFARARPEEDSGILQPLPLIKETLKLLQASRPRGILLRTRFSEEAEGARIAMDPSRLQQIVLNLYANAVQAMEGEGTLAISADLVSPETGEDSEDRFRLVFADTGRGFDEPTAARIFDPFFTTKGVLGDGDVPCTGLGLSVAQGIVTAHGGTIGVESTAGRGTTVDMRFPAVELGEVSETSPAATQQPSASETEAVRPMEPRRVLVADDDDELRELLGETLTGAGYVVTTVESATKAVEALQTGEFDVVLSDVKMPGGGGQAVVGAALELAQAPPVLLITGWTDGNLQQELLSLGARACLPKPISVRDLLAAVSDCLS